MASCAIASETAADLCTTSTAPGVSVVRDVQLVVHTARLGGTLCRAAAASSKRAALVRFSPKFSVFLRKSVALGEPNSKHVNSGGPTVNGLTSARRRSGPEQSEEHTSELQ